MLPSVGVSQYYHEQFTNIPILFKLLQTPLSFQYGGIGLPNTTNLSHALNNQMSTENAELAI